MVSTNPARGMRDFLPADVRKREYVIGIIKQVYESYGFEPLETPAVENIETLMGKYGEEGNQLIFRVLVRGGKLDTVFQTLRNSLMHARADVPLGDISREIPLSNLADLALRYDLTVPFARVVTNCKERIPRFFKRYQIQPVWRADRPARGRFREFYQCDVDVIGSDSITVEAELISAVSDILRRLGFSDFRISLNHRRILFDILNDADVPEELWSNALVGIDKLDKIGAKGVGEELANAGVSTEAARKILDLFEKIDLIRSQGKDVHRVILSVLPNSGDQSYLEDIGRLTDLASDHPIVLDPKLARGLSYYTGTIMEINVDGIGSLGGGGRYDGLIGMFGKEQIPACGFSLGLERILVVMDERNMFPPEIADSTPADVMVTIWSDETVAESLRLATELRASGLRVTLYPEDDKLGKQIKYADTIKVPWVCVLGETEIAEGKVTVKNMRTGEQITLPLADAVKKIKN